MQVTDEIVRSAAFQSRPSLSLSASGSGSGSGSVDANGEREIGSQPWHASVASDSERQNL
jgi:hypothetical protein